MQKGGKLQQSARVIFMAENLGTPSNSACFESTPATKGIGCKDFLHLPKDHDRYAKKIFI